MTKWKNSCMSPTQQPHGISLRSKKKTKSNKSAKLEQASRIQKSEEGVLACAHGWEKSASLRADLGQAFAFSVLTPFLQSTLLGEWS